MISVLAFALGLLGGSEPPQWFGPVAVSFDAASEGNPYDAERNDVRVRFEGETTEERLAYYDAGRWKAVLVTNKPGKYRAKLVRNGEATSQAAKTVRVDSGQRLRDGYLRVDPNKRRFRFDSGKAFFPIGHNLGWQAEGAPDMTAQLKTMGENGINWSRVWACSWDGKNPYWPSDDFKETKLKDGEMWPKAFQRWDQLVTSAEKAGIRFQFVLFHHGLVSSLVNPNWPQHPWNAVNGGFLKNAADFFSDTTAKRLVRNWLRYAVARWGHSPSVMAWELFNEVEWADARYQNRASDIAAWHKEMAGYLRSIDPYHHMVTTSSDMAIKGLYDAADYYQPHSYPSSVLGAVMGCAAPGDKPLFFGEVGPGAYDPKAERAVVRDSIWSGVLANHAGCAQYWYWDRMLAHGFYGEYKIGAQVLRQCAFQDHPAAKPVAIGVKAPLGGKLTFSPGGGWADTKRFHFRLPEDGKPSVLSALSGFFQSQKGQHRDMCPEPLVFEFEAKKPGVFAVSVASVAKAGAALHLSVNGKPAAEKSWGPSESDRTAPERLSAEFPAGHVTVKLENDGADWVVIRSFSVDGVAPMASGLAVGETEFLLIRLTTPVDAALPLSVELSNLGLVDGEYRARVTDLDTGAESRATIQVKGGAALSPFSLKAKDAVIVLAK